MLNVVIPCAGRARRFTEAGYLQPKPLINISKNKGIDSFLYKPMIEGVIESLNLDIYDPNYIFIILKEHLQYGIENELKRVCKYCQIIYLDEVTSGAAETVLKAEHLIDNDDPLLICNSDQLFEWNPVRFLSNVELCHADAGVLTFMEPTKNPKWSFVNFDGQRILEVAEKNPISDIATVGAYYISYGSNFIWAIKKMMKDNFRVNGEWYVAPALNYLIKDGMKVIPWFVDNMIGLGTPEDLEKYLGS